MSPPTPVVSGSAHEDPLVTSARKEALLVIVLWLLATVWSVGVYATMGFKRDVKTLTYVCGFPDWIFWGIVLPWGVCTLFSLWFGTWFMRDLDLGHDADTPAEENP